MKVLGPLSEREATLIETALHVYRSRKMSLGAVAGSRMKFKKFPNASRDYDQYKMEARELQDLIEKLF